MLRDAISLCEVSRYPVRYSPGGHFHFEKDGGGGLVGYFEKDPLRGTRILFCVGAWLEISFPLKRYYF